MSLLSLLASSEDSSGGAALLSWGVLLLIPLAMYFLMIRPQRRRMKEQQGLQSALKVGDEVVTTAGIYGFITGEDGPSRFWLELDENVQVRIARAAIASKVDTSTEDQVAETPAIDVADDDTTKTDTQ
jgi:preprotein translocase subunit YajC